MPRFQVLVALATLLVAPAVCPAGVPVLYTTDLYHPHDDPDDHFDLATLFALPELDVRGIVIDRTNSRRNDHPGVVALEQIFHLSGRSAPFALGLREPLRADTDPALDRPEEDQAGVRLILSVLRASAERVQLFTTGSLADVAAAFNREPALLREKVAAIHVNAGRGPDGYQEEWNVILDPHAFRRVMLSGLPVRWYPCFGREGFRTYFKVEQSDVLGGCGAPLRAFFEYALSKSDADPIAFLDGEFPAPKGPRNMWCTPAFLELAGRRIYRTGKGYAALREPPAPGAKPVSCYRMRPVRLTEATEPELPPEGAYARFAGREKDLIGKGELDPDGSPDCLVRIHRLPAGKALRSATLRSPRDGLWTLPATPGRWRLGAHSQGAVLELFFAYYAWGEHELELVFEDGEKLALSFYVHTPGVPQLRAELDAEGAPVRVIQQAGAPYGAALTACLTGLLESYPGR